MSFKIFLIEIGVSILALCCYGFMVARDRYQLRKLEANIEKYKRERPKARIIRIGTIDLGPGGHQTANGWRFCLVDGTPAFSHLITGEPVLCGWTFPELAEISARRKEFE